MKILVLLLCLSACLIAAGQSMPAPSRDAELQRQRETIQNQRQAELRGEKIRLIVENSYRGKRVPRTVIGDVKALYRTPTGKELRTLQPLSEDLQKFASFLRKKRTGIVRLEPYKDCGDSTRVLSVSNECLEFPFPGNGSDYSFRERSYRLGRLADLRFGPSGFSSPGVLQQAIFVGLGDVPLDQITLSSNGLRYLTGVRPIERLDEAIAFSREFDSGREVDGHFYAPVLRAVANMTYVLRSIAYKGLAMRAIGGFVYNEIEFDDRADIVVAFRIVRTHENGAVTILWKELSRQNAPEIMRRKPADRNRDQKKFTTARK